MALRRNILVFHQGALGDFILTWPVALALARIHPQSRLFYVTHAQKGKLAEKALGVESTDAETGWHTLFGEGATSLPETPGKLLAGAHSILGFVGDPDGPWARNVKRLAPDANVLTVNPKPPDDWAGHATDFHLEQLRPWQAAHAAAIQIHRSIRARGIGLTRPAELKDIVIHPGSGSPAKNWPIEKYLELIQRLRAGGTSVRVLLGEVEQEKWDANAAGRLAEAARMTRPSSYLDLMAELMSARAFVGNDSGPGHLAGILGVPTLTLYGPSDPVRWKPLGPDVQTLRGESMDAISVDQVLAAMPQ
jgi:ADP-heptose:LPS heptosyltransferase